MDRGYDSPLTRLTVHTIQKETAIAGEHPSEQETATLHLESAQ
jgi:hypothetical protein